MQRRRVRLKECKNIPQGHTVSKQRFKSRFLIIIMIIVMTIVVACMQACSLPEAVLPVLCVLSFPPGPVRKTCYSPFYRWEN